MRLYGTIVSCYWYYTDIVNKMSVVVQDNDFSLTNKFSGFSMSYKIHNYNAKLIFIIIIN